MNKSVFENHPKFWVQEYQLKPISMKDLNEIEELCSYYPPERRRTGKELIDIIDKEYKEQSGINWGIYLKDELVGTIGFYRGFEKNQGELGYVLREQFRNKGIGSACARVLTQIGFSKMELDAIEAFTAIDNEASKKLLISSGFSRIDHKDPKTAAFRIENDRS